LAEKYHLQKKVKFKIMVNFQQNTQLLCTFSDIKYYNKTINDIISTYNILDNKIYVLQNIKTDEVYLTYNAYKNLNNSMYKTISVHRKKQSNTLYTINSINEIIKFENNGILDSNYIINWNEYTNCILLTNNEGLRILHTKLLKIFYANS
jgi:hypothetical protein